MYWVAIILLGYVAAHRVRTLKTTLAYVQGKFRKLEKHLEIDRAAVEEDVVKVEKEDDQRNLFILEKESGAKI